MRYSKVYQESQEIILLFIRIKLNCWRQRNRSSTWWIEI